MDEGDSESDTLSLSKREMFNGLACDWSEEALESDRTLPTFELE